MRFADLVATSERVAEASGRLEKVGLLAELLSRLAPEEVETAVVFLSGTPRQGRIGVGPAALAQARPQEAAAEAILTVAQVDRALAEVAGLSGPDSGTAKVERLRRLFARATPPEQDFLLRLLFGELRQGALEGVLAESVARASGVSPRKVRRAVMMAGDLGAVARAALAAGEAGLAGFSVRLFQPVQPMLAQPADGASAALERLGEAAFEVKMDGARIQVHKAGDEVRVYSRSLKEVTPAVPEVVELARALPAREAILDGEVIALRDDGTPHPFQVTMRRFGRKLDVERMRSELPLTPFLFDLLHAEGGDLVDEPYQRRLAALEELAPAETLVPRTVTGEAAAAEAFLAQAIARGHEGVLAKALDAPYEAGSRGYAWLKVKPAQTLDLVVLAAEWGHGRRRGWLSNLHLGARDADRGGFVMLGKTFKGLTDRLLAWQTEQLLARAVGREGHIVHVRPELVVEIAFNDLQASPHYPGGLALRFARVKRYRDDKTAEQADTFATVREIYRRTTGEEPPERR